LNLIVDIGNSFYKLAEFENKKFIKLYRFSEVDDCVELMKQNKYTKSIISSVRSIDTLLFETMERLNINYTVLNHETDLPIGNRYKTKESLGVDRIAACVAANHYRRFENILVIDAGTAITFDYMNEDNEYLGGSISPGLEMRYKALNHFTGKLPLYKVEFEYNKLGGTTEECIRAGVQNGFIFEIQKYIHDFRIKHSSAQVFVTGGDSDFIKSNIEEDCIYNSNLVLDGLNIILEHIKG
jgi:type III pantothenate kinase